MKINSVSMSKSDSLKQSLLNSMMKDNSGSSKGKGSKRDYTHNINYKSKQDITFTDEIGFKNYLAQVNETDKKYKASHVLADVEFNIANDFIKDQEMNRKEKENFLRLFELGVYYIHNGKIHIDSKKFKEFEDLNNLNTKFDKKVERKAYKKYNKYAQKRFGHLTYHGSPEEERIKHNDPVTYKQIEFEKDQFINNFKSKFEKKRYRYIKKHFKKKYGFNKWKNKYGYSL